MKEFKYKPKKLVDENGNEMPIQWAGSVIMKVPNYRERLQLIKSMNISVGENGEAKKEDGIDSALKMLEIVEHHVVAIDLKFGDMAAVSVDDLGCTKEGSALLNELGVVVLQGISLGNG